MAPDPQLLRFVFASVISMGVMAPAWAADSLARVVRAGMNSPSVSVGYDIAIQKGTRVLRPDLQVRPRASERPGASVDREGDELLAAKIGLAREFSGKSSGREYDRLLRSIWREHGEYIRTAAAKHDVPEDLILAVIAIESSGRHDAVSPKGAKGLMQLMPDTAAWLGVGDVFDPASNINGGTALLSRLTRMYGNDRVLTLAAYNAGEGAVARYGGVPPYSETKAYIPSVLGAALAATRLTDLFESPE